MPTDIRQKLATAFPAYRWLSEPLATVPTVTATTADRVITIVQNPSAFSISICATSNGHSLCDWTDPRSIEAILPILGGHLVWFAPIKQEKLAVKPLGRSK